MVRVGFRGPITENVRINANVGQSYGPDPGESDTLYGASITHQPRSTTSHSLSYWRGFSEPESELTDTVRYRLMQGLGPHLRGSFTALWSKSVTDSGNNAADDNTVDEEWGVGAGLDFQPGGKLTLSLRETYTVSDMGGGRDTEEKEWLSRIMLRYYMTDRLRLGLSYEYTDLKSSAAGQSYQENLIRFWLTYVL